MNWEDQAPCKEIGTEVFYVGDEIDGDQTGSRTTIWAAKQFCKSSCNFTDQCLDLAMTREYGAAREDRFGVWGGLGPIERHRLAVARGEDMRQAGQHKPVL